MPKNKPNVFDDQNITVVEFFKTHWQRAPYLFTNTTIDLSCLPSIDQLFTLAAEEDVQSRIVYSTDHIRYQAMYDEPDAWEEVKSYKPTLLVSDIEKWYPNALKLMSWFPFIKSWRFDDLMISYAPKGASVGAHTDHYDVFLVQVQGTRKWTYDDQPLADCEMVEDSELSVIKNYNPQHEAVLKPGDVLYLPPEIPHHGISTSNDCVTCSIGLRAPSEAEFLTSFTELMVQNASPKNRFKDGVNQLNSDASIGTHEINYLRKHLAKMNQMEDTALAELFGQVITNYRLFDELNNQTITPEIETIRQWRKSPFSAFAYHKTGESSATLMVNGEVHLTSLMTAITICNESNFSLDEIKSKSIKPTTDSKIMNELIQIQAIIPA